MRVSQAGRARWLAALFAEQLRHALPVWPNGIGYGR
jgi:hypothetical protein